MTEQATLIPLPSPTMELMIDVKWLHIPEGTPRDARLQASIARYGVLVPLILEDNGSSRHTILDGRRRSAAAVAAGVHFLPAIIYQAGDVDREKIALTTNAVRSANEMGEYRAIESLLARGLSESEVAAEVWMAVAVIRRRLKLGRMEPSLVVALEQGKMAPGTAQLASCLPLAQQRQLATIWEGGGRITAEDVRQVKRAKADSDRAKQLEIPPLAAPEDDDRNDWRTMAALALGEIKGRLLDEHDDAAAHLIASRIDHIIGEVLAE